MFPVTCPNTRVGRSAFFPFFFLFFFLKGILHKQWLHIISVYQHIVTTQYASIHTQMNILKIMWTKQGRGKLSQASATQYKDYKKKLIFTFFQKYIVLKNRNTFMQVQQFNVYKHWIVNKRVFYHCLKNNLKPEMACLFTVQCCFVC